MASWQDHILNDHYWIQYRQLIHQAALTVINSSKISSLLESLYAMNNEPEEDAIELIAERVNSTKADIANWFALRRAVGKGAHQMGAAQQQGAAAAAAAHQLEPQPQIALDTLNSFAGSPLGLTPSPLALTPSPLALTPQKAHPPAVPSSSLLSKLNAVTARLDPNVISYQLDDTMIDLLNALYAINDNPEPAAIEMIARRINVPAQKIADWFDKKRLEINPLAGPRSPPVKKREGGRVVTFSEYQRSLLEAIFDENNYLHPQEYEELSNLIQVPSRNIKIWFKNRRSKQRLSGRSATPVNYSNPK